MTRLDPNPPADGRAGHRVRGDRGRALDARRARARPPRPRDARRGRPGRRLRRDRLPDRAAPGGLERPRRVVGRRRAGRPRVRAAVLRPDRPPARCASPSLPPRLARAVERRLAGDRRARIDLDLRGTTEFEQAVWLKALEIPRGEVRPYGWIAAEIGRPKAVRAVGTALGHNPIPLIVPVPPGRPERRLRSASTRWADRPTSGRSSPPRAPTRTASRGWRRPASATSARTRRGSSACRRATTPGA